MDARCCADRLGWACGAAVAAILLGVCAGSARAGPAEDTRQREARRLDEEGRLRKVREEIEDLRRRLEESEATAGSVLDAIDEMDLRMALLRRESESLRDEVRDTAERERLARREAVALEARLRQTESGLRDYLRETYKIGPARYLRVVTAASSPAQVAAGYRAIEAMSLGEAERIESYRADRESLEGILIELRSQGTHLRDLQATLDGKGRDLRDVRERKAAVLADLQRKQASQKVLLDDLVRVEGEIRALLDRLARPGPGEGVPSLGFARHRGQLGWPAAGRLLVPFGNVRHPRFSTEVPHPGIDIAASPGQEVRAVFDGRVVFSDWFKGYGQMVVIDHGDSYLSIYGHVDERLVAAGQDVAGGELIARSGRSGSYDQPGLYFEIRHEGRPEDPASWLRGASGAPAGRKRPGVHDHRETAKTP